MFDIPYVGSAKQLPKGWHRATEVLLDKYLSCQQYGLADTHAPQLLLPAQSLGQNQEPPPAVKEAMKLLAGFVQPTHPHVGLGMAYPQLEAAALTGVWAVFAAMTDLTGLTADHLRPGRLFINPRIEPIESAGKSVGVEACFSCLVGSLVAEVERWNAVVLVSDNHDPIRLEGPAAIPAQHEYGHLQGKLCVNVAFQTGRRVFYVPPELHGTFFALNRQGRRHEYPHDFPYDQWEASLSGDFTLRSHLPLK